MQYDPLTTSIAAATWAVAVGTIVLMWWQMSQQRELNSAATILSLRDRFDTEQMRTSRRRLSQHLLLSREPHVGDIGVLRFFELLGFLTHGRVLDRRMVWNAFGGWATSYHYLLTHPVDRIEAWRRQFHDPSAFQEFGWLSAEMARLDSSVAGPRTEETREEDYQSVLRNEVALETAR